LRGPLRNVINGVRKPGDSCLMTTSLHADRVAALRSRLDDLGLAGFVVPLTDEHASEYVADYAQRLAWLTGFAGSAGTAVVLARHAALFIDGRYTLQAEAQVDHAVFERHNIAETRLLDWLAEHAETGMRIGFDPRLHSPAWVEKAEEALGRSGAHLIAVKENPIDAVWSDQPDRPHAPVVAHPVEFAGKESAEKRREITEAIAAKKADAAAITMLDSIAWLFNIRGGDVRHTPVTLAYAILAADGSATLFIDQDKLTKGLVDHLGSDVRLAPYERFYEDLSGLGRGGRAVIADPATANAAVFTQLEAGGARIIKAADPCALPKACKNDVEIAGVRAAHLRDGAALTDFLCWLDRAAPQGGLDELAVAERLDTFRRRNPEYVGPSFDTISGAGPNGAIVHYRVSAESSRSLAPGMLYLVDSGGQYPDGTTDVTRTVPVGTVGTEERAAFTAVLKGHIALATLRFPDGTTGAQIDAIARRPLWELGVDYDHGTGHGVGAYLGVHEGPQRIAKQPNATALTRGMICSNEPGYYRTGRFGIRIENLVLVTMAPHDPDEREMRGFETLTLAPIDRRLIMTERLTAAERSWVDAYHVSVREALLPLVAPETRGWLEEMTAPLADGGASERPD